MTRWTAFAGFVGVVLAALLALTRVSADAVRTVESRESTPTASRTRTETKAVASAAAAASAERTVATRPVATGPGESETGPLDRLRQTEPEPRPEWADAAADREVWLVVSAATVADGPIVGQSTVGGSASSPAATAGSAGAEAGRANAERVGRATDTGPSVGGVDPSEGVTAAGLSTRSMLANVAVSQLLFGALIAGAAWWAAVPAFALGLDPLGGMPAVTVGLWIGVGLWGASELFGRIARRAGVDPATGLRESLAPSTRSEWAALLGVVLPVVAGFEELLFRGVLIGAVSIGFGLPEWGLVIASSVAFAAGHSAQGRLGVAVTGVLGLVLGATFVVTESLLAVIVAHYVVNAAEFLVHES